LVTDLLNIEDHAVDRGSLLPRIKLENGCHTEGSSFHAHAEAGNPFTVAKVHRAAQRHGDLKNIGGHAGSVVVNRDIGFVVSPPPGLAEKDSNFGRTGLDGVIDVLAKR